MNVYDTYVAASSICIVALATRDIKYTLFSSFSKRGFFLISLFLENLFPRELSSIFIGIYYQTITHTLLKIDRIRFREIVRYSFHDEDIRLTFSYNPIRIARSRLLQQKCRSRSFLSRGSRKYLTGNRSIRQKADQGAEVPNIETIAWSRFEDIPSFST